MKQPNNINEVLAKLNNVIQVDKDMWEADCPCPGRPHRMLVIDNGDRIVPICLGYKNKGGE